MDVDGGELRFGDPVLGRDQRRLRLVVAEHLVADVHGGPDRWLGGRRRRPRRLRDHGRRRDERAGQR
jgi:hypothetical protein